MHHLCLLFQCFFFFFFFCKKKKKKKDPHPVVGQLQGHLDVGVRADALALDEALGVHVVLEDAQVQILNLLLGARDSVLNRRHHLNKQTTTTTTKKKK